VWDELVVGAWRHSLSIRETHAHETRVVDGVETSWFHYGQSAVGADSRLEVMVIDELSHSYANGSNHPVVLVDVLWEFFRAHQRSAMRRER